MYLGPYSGQLDFGGKTGTSNNHSDAWFVAVTPSLVAGAWVGGEYRSIHFRTGALGQGSRTALPIVAQFLRSVMDDGSLKGKYLHKYGMPPEDIDASTYQGGAYVAPKVASDSLANDSIAEGADDYEGHEAAEDVEPSSSSSENAEGGHSESSASSHQHSSEQKQPARQVDNLFE